ncbi:MAG TPA: hypothetical protein VF457_06775 [Burkholderiaceae bacterium]
MALQPSGQGISERQACRGSSLDASAEAAMRRLEADGRPACRPSASGIIASVARRPWICIEAAVAGRRRVGGATAVRDGDHRGHASSGCPNGPDARPGCLGVAPAPIGFHAFSGGWGGMLGFDRLAWNATRENAGGDHSRGIQMTESADEQGSKSDFELESRNDWVRFVGSGARRYYGDAVQVDVYGKADALYLVIEKRVSSSPPRSVDQYVVDTLEFTNPRMKLIELLQAFDFSLSRLLSRLGQLEYDDADGSARLEGIDVFHRFIRETLRGEKGQRKMKSGKQKTASAQKKIVVTKRKLDPAASTKARSFKEIARSLSPVADRKSSSLRSNVEEIEEWE